VNTFDSVVAVLDYSSFTVTVVASQSASLWGNDVLITFPASVLRAGGMLSERATRTVEISSDSGTEQLTYEPANLYRAEVENFCRLLDGHISIGTSPTEAAVITRVLLDVEDAIRTGRLVDI
jgi:hypothetical protein